MTTDLAYSNGGDRVAGEVSVEGNRMELVVPLESVTLEQVDNISYLAELSYEEGDGPSLVAYIDCLGIGL